MRVYHFTCADHGADPIRREGLRVGRMLYILGGVAFPWSDAFSWATTDADPAAQTWATRNLVTCDRTTVRFTLDVPSAWVIPWSVFRQAWPGDHHGLREFEGNHNTIHWRLVRLPVPKESIEAIWVRPTASSTPAPGKGD